MTKLTNDQKFALELQLRKARDASERNRLCVILGHNEGLSLETLAKVLRLSHSTVCAYLNDFDSKNKTQNDSKGGMDPKLTDTQSQSLSKYLNEHTYLKVKFIRAYVWKKFGILYLRSGMTTWLKNHDFVFKRPRKVSGKLDSQQQENFIQKYEELKASLTPGEEIFFVDAVHPEHQSQAVCGWIKKAFKRLCKLPGSNYEYI